MNELTSNTIVSDFSGPYEFTFPFMPALYA